MSRFKEKIVKLNRRIFGKTILRLDEETLAFEKEISHRRADFAHSLTIEYRTGRSGLLNALCDRYGSDKGELQGEGHPYRWRSHTYADMYDLLFRLRRFDVERVVECGIGTNNPNLSSSMGAEGKPGASLRVWREYFPNAEIIGIDIDGDILFQENRIRTFQCDQTSRSSIDEFIARSAIEHGSVDIIIDDGLHDFSAGVCLFECSNMLLTKNGIYVIEDVTGADYINYKDYFADSHEDFQVTFMNLHRPGDKLRDNRLIVISRVLPHGPDAENPAEDTAHRE